MRVTKTITIAGCGLERNDRCTFAYVELEEPEKIGQHLNRATQTCLETPLKRRIVIDVNATGNVIDDGTDTKRAEVLISCPATDCPHHT